MDHDDYCLILGKAYVEFEKFKEQCRRQIITLQQSLVQKDEELAEKNSTIELLQTNLDLARRE